MQGDKVGELYYKLTLGKEDFDRGVKSVSSKFDSLAHKAADVAKKIALAAKVATAAFVGLGIKVAADLETARQGFITLLGSADKADATIARVKKEALRTPFEIPGLTKATQLLSSVTKDGDEAVDILMDVGEGLAAMGKGQGELDRIIVNLQQIASAGRATTLDIRQFAFAGLPIYEMLQEITGKTGEEVSEMISNGEVSFELLTKMFKQATEEGGRFYGAFKNQAGTFSQVLSNTKDAFQMFAADFVTRLGIFDWAKDALSGVTDWVNENQDAWIEAIINIGAKLKEWGKALIEVGKVIWEYLEPKLRALWESIQNKVIPHWERLWKEVIEPLIPVIGTVLVVAIGLVIDAFNFLITVLDPLNNLLIELIKFVKENEVVFGALAIAIGAVWAIMQINRAVIAFQASMQLVVASIQGVIAKIVGAGGIKAAMGSFATYLKSPAVLGPWGVFATAAVLAFKKIYDEGQKTIQLLDEVNNKIDANEKSNDEALRRVNEQWKAGKITDEQYKAILLNNNTRAEGGPVTSNTPYLVGEKGPELFVPRNNGTIIPNNELGKSNTTIYGNITIGSQQDADNFFQRLTRNQELSAKGLASRPGSV